MRKLTTHPPKNHPAFTLVETVISIGVVATLILSFLAVFGLATDSIHETVDRRDADRLIAALDRELSILRVGEADADTLTAFDKAYQWIDKSSRGDAGNIFLYNYQGDPSTERADGSLQPVPGAVGAGGDSVATPAVWFIEDGELPDEMRAELDATFGLVLFVRLTQLVYEDGKLVEGEPGIVPPHQGQSPLPAGDGASSSYPEATIAFNADFFLLPTNAPEYIAEFTTGKLRRPTFSRPMAVRR